MPRRHRAGRPERHDQLAPANLGLVAERIRVYLEVGGKRSFASAADWPGWARPGKTEEAALEALAGYAPRYAKVAKLAKLDFPNATTDFEVVERLQGNASTDYGVPGTPAKLEARPLTAKQTIATRCTGTSWRPRWSTPKGWAFASKSPIAKPCSAGWRIHTATGDGRWPTRFGAPPGTPSTTRGRWKTAYPDRS